MWPDDYIDWGLKLRPQVAQSTRHQLDILLQRNPLLSLAVNDLAEQAAQRAFNEANDRRRFPGYFQDEAQFWRWLNVVALREAHALLLGHADVVLYLRRLSGEHRRLLGMMFLDRLPYGDIAAVLRVTADEARQRGQAAVGAFWDLLR
jgi:hypothetical protein